MNPGVLGNAAGSLLSLLAPLLQSTLQLPPAAATVGAYLLESAAVELPIWLAVVAAAVNALLYGLFFRRYVPPEERHEQTPAPADWAEAS